MLTGVKKSWRYKSAVQTSAKKKAAPLKKGSAKGPAIASLATRFQIAPDIKNASSDGLPSILEQEVAKKKPSPKQMSSRQRALQAIDAEFVAEDKVAHEISEILSLGQRAPTKEAVVQKTSAKARELASTKKKANMTGNAEHKTNAEPVPKSMAARVLQPTNNR